MQQQVQDYCTAQTGITAAALESPHAISFDKARKMIQKKIVGKILVGHGLEVDLAALGLSHPWCDIRDAATYAPFMMRSSSQLLLPQDLGDLAATVLQRENIMGCPQREAMACLDLYKETRREWEADLIRIAQEKEQRREMVMNMRSGGRLSSIREDREISHLKAFPEPSLASTTEPAYSILTATGSEEDEDSSSLPSISSTLDGSAARGNPEIENLHEFLGQMSLHPQHYRSPPHPPLIPLPSAATPPLITSPNDSQQQPWSASSSWTDQQVTPEELHCLPSELWADVGAQDNTSLSPRVAAVGLEDRTSHPPNPAAVQEWLPPEEKRNTWFRSLRARSSPSSSPSSHT